MTVDISILLLAVASGSLVVFIGVWVMSIAVGLIPKPKLRIHRKKRYSKRTLEMLR